MAPARGNWSHFLYSRELTLQAAGRRYFLLTRVSKIISERPTTIFFSALFSSSRTSSTNSVSVLSFEGGGQSVGELRLAAMEGERVKLRLLC